ncbi:hypothetical protein CDAR_265561 [Caerostris darwini]|uniref:Uncharacterized protein n=1 Tax=Caerostris darwini TaxID=1538125 RepID=A0AAV4VV74_9ARAC|nr:hypothetical protein CDAR_265561 [Caerostris darwini]
MSAGDDHRRAGEGLRYGVVCDGSTVNGVKGVDLMEIPVSTLPTSFESSPRKKEFCIQPLGFPSGNEDSAKFAQTLDANVSVDKANILLIRRKLIANPNSNTRARVIARTTTSHGKKSRSYTIIREIDGFGPSTFFFKNKEDIFPESSLLVCYRKDSVQNILRGKHINGWLVVEVNCCLSYRIA